MLIDAVVLLAIGGVLTLLALIASYYIVIEIIQALRELSEERVSPGWKYGGYDASVADRVPDIGQGSGDTGPLRSRKRGVTIKPVRDAQSVKQLIAHFKDDDAAPDDDA
jgi:hypothetical protein